MESDGASTVRRITTLSEIAPFSPAVFTFFGEYLPHFVKEILSVDGEAYVCQTPEQELLGLFIYDGAEKTGTIFTRSRPVFDLLFALKPFDFIFSEMQIERESEIFDIYSLNLQGADITHRFHHEITMAGPTEVGELEKFVFSSDPRMNRKWVRAALDSGERCFIARLGKQIAGAGWVSLVEVRGRLHSLYVAPQFRRLHIGEDILFARLLYLKSIGAASAFSEISRHNLPSAKIAQKGGMAPAAQLYLYFRKDLPLKTPSLARL